jgi:hypothetical protein
MAQFFLFMAHFFLATSLWGGSYTLADLEALVNEGGHDEFFKHALDIRPSERQEAWRGMVIKMADLMSKETLNKSEIKAIDYKKIENLYRWPSIKEDDVYKARRQEIGLRYLKTCLKGHPPCLEDLKHFWESDPTDPDTAFKLAELTTSLSHPTLSPWTFLSVALKSPLSEFYCKEEFAMNQLWKKFELDYIRLGPKGDFLKKIDQTVHPECLPYLITEARKRLKGPLKYGDRELAFKILDVQSKADQKLSDFFYTAYLLERPSQGELFNYSWNRLKDLGKSSERREAVLSWMRMMDPLPDEILNSLDITKKRVILSHFKKHFPEYLDFYVDQCTQFYGGKGSFPHGNPTIHCQDFMKSELAPQLLDKQKIQQYEKVHRI